MSIRELPARKSALAHAKVPVPASVDAGPAAPRQVAPSHRTVFEREFEVAHRAQTVAVSRRETPGGQRVDFTTQRIRAIDRLDPFHEIEWVDQFDGGDWQRVSVRRHRLTTNARGNVVVSTAEAFAPVAVDPSKSYSANMMRIMALLVQYGCLTTSQLCAFLDVPYRSIGFALNRLYETGIVERMTPGWVKTTVSARPYHGSGDVWRLHLRSTAVDGWLAGLSPTERALLTGGRDSSDLLRNGTFVHAQTLRHNLQVAELCLRVLETVPGIAGVWGEPFADGPRFLSEMVRNSVEIRGVRADAAIVTKDGSAIAVEVTGVQNALGSLHGSLLAERAAAWAMIAHMSDVPMSLVVVATGRYAATRRIVKHLREHTDRELGRYFSNVADRKRALDMIHVVSAQNWWPSEAATSRKFLTLEAYNPFSDDFRELAPADARWNTSAPMVVNTVAAMHTPPWALRPVQPLTEGAA